MRRINFLVKLAEEGQLKIVEPSENVKLAYIDKSRSSLRSTTILVENDQIGDAVPLAYYSMYYMLTALLYKVGIKCENHAAAIILLKELFHTDDAKIRFAKNERVDKQYYVDFKITKQDVIEMIKIAKDFNSMLHSIIEKMTTSQAAAYREELKKALL